MYLRMMMIMMMDVIDCLCAMINNCDDDANDDVMKMTVTVVSEDDGGD